MGHLVNRKEGLISGEKELFSLPGGHVVVPKTEKQNLDVVAIAEQYYKVSTSLYPSLC